MQKGEMLCQKTAMNASITTTAIQLSVGWDVNTKKKSKQKGEKTMNKKLIRRILAVAVIATFLIGTMSFAQEYDAEIPTEDIQVINAESIGIKTIPKEVATDEIIIPENENPTVDETTVYEEEVEYEKPVQTEPAETKKEDSLQKAIEPVEEEDLSEPPEGMYEGCVSGEYLPINYYDCELHDGCYMCEEHRYEESIGWEEENGVAVKWWLERFCTVCGHGTSIEISEEEAINFENTEEGEE
jgi:hypothetical protein